MKVQSNHVSNNIKKMTILFSSIQRKKKGAWIVRDALAENACNMVARLRISNALENVMLFSCKVQTNVMPKIATTVKFHVHILVKNNSNALTGVMYFS